VIVVSLIARELDALRELARSQLEHADAIELRLDGLADPVALREDDLSRLVRSIEKPVIVAVNAPDAHGRFTGDTRTRLELLERAAHAGAAYVDVDWKLASLWTPSASWPATCRRIVSRHDTQGTPTDLARAFGELSAAARPTDLLKFVAHAHSGEDGVRLLEFTRGFDREVIAFSSGEAGRFTRLLAPIFGSVATYAAPARGASSDSASTRDTPSSSTSTRDTLPGSAPTRGTPSSLASTRDTPSSPPSTRGTSSSSAPSDAAFPLVDGGPTAPGQWRVDELRAAWPRAGVTRDTAVYAVLGRPVRASLSPRLHGAVFRDSGRDAVYVAIEPRALETFLPLCASDRWRGLSVTAPFKEAASRLADERDEETRDVRAANTLVRQANGGWSASNTDTTAVEDVLRRCLELARVPARNARCLVIGTGGAARAALAAIDRLGCESIVVTGRDIQKTIALALDRAVEAAEMGDVVERVFDVVVQCTPAGSYAQPDVMPIDACVLRPGQVFVEAVYRPTRTPLVIAAERVGAIVMPGADWFLAQARGQAMSFAQGPWAEPALKRELDAALAEEVATSATTLHGGAPNDLTTDARRDDAEAPSERSTSDLAPRETDSTPSPLAPTSATRPLKDRRAPPEQVRHLSGVGQFLTRAFPHARRPQARARLTRTIALVGLRGSGKSTVAKLLAHAFDAPVIDLDEQIVRIANEPSLTTPADVLRARGEADFRRLESMALTALLTCGEPHVLATGGGVIENESNRALLAAHSTVVWLRVSTPELQRRLAADPTPRPPLVGPDAVSEVPELARRREPLYADLARHVVDAEGATPLQVADTIARLVFPADSATIS